MQLMRVHMRVLSACLADSEPITNGFTVYLYHNALITRAGK